MRAAILLLGLLAATPGLSDPAPSRLFPEGESTCFAAPATPAASTAQGLALIKLAGPDPLSENGAWDRMLRGRGLPPGEHASPVWGAVRLRGERSYRLAWMGCEARGDGSERCGIDCDGGGVVLRPDGEGLALRSEGMRLSASCGSGRSRAWPAGPHDTHFRLRRLDAPACRRAMEEIRPGFAGDGPPLADRIASGQTAFERAYDPAHLARHPGQTVAFLKIAWTGLDPEDPNRGRAALFARLRGGEAVALDVTCRPDGFTLSCIPDRGDGGFELRRAGGGVLLDFRTDEPMSALAGRSLGREDDVFRLEPAPR